MDSDKLRIDLFVHVIQDSDPVVTAINAKLDSLIAGLATQADIAGLVTKAQQEAKKVEAVADSADAVAKQ